MNETDKIYYSDLHQVDNQIYHELNQQAGERDVEVYNELRRPGERNKRYYDEVNNTGQSYYQELSQLQASQKQASIENKLQIIIKMVIFLTVVLLLILLLLGISTALITVMFINLTTTPVPDTVIAAAVHVQQNELTSLLENITETVTSLQHLLDEQVTYLLNNTNTVNLIQQSSTQKLINIVSTLNNLKGISNSIAGVVNDILLVVEELLEIQNASVLFNSIQPVSCKDIKTVLPNSPTGYYHVNSHNIYCNMGELCGTGGGWTRLAYVDMSDSTVNCPTGFRLYQSRGVRACGRPVSSCGGCSSVQYPSNGISYSQICGRVVGYQYGTPNAVDTLRGDKNINSYYVDGVSITHGSPRQHVWTLMAGLFDSHYHNRNCPCNTPPGDTQQVQSFVGSNYYCESGNSNDTWTTNTLYTGDPLWDGEGCGTNETICCSAPGLPWFHRDYGNVTTTDYIELRVCGDQSTTNEDVPVSFYEIYIK